MAATIEMQINVKNDSIVSLITDYIFENHKENEVYLGCDDYSEYCYYYMDQDLFERVNNMLLANGIDSTMICFSYPAIVGTFWNKK